MGEYRIYISDIIYVIRKNYKYIISLSIVGLVVGMLIYAAQRLMSGTSVSYETTASLNITAEVGNSGFANGGNNPNAQDITMLNNLLDSVVYVCSSSVLTDRVVETLQLTGVQGNQIGRALTVNRYNTTQIVQIKLDWGNREEGERIVRCICEVLPDVLKQTMKIGGVGIIDNPITREIRPTNTPKTILYVAVLGIMLGVGICVLPLFIRPSLISLPRVEELLGIPRIGEIPETENAGRIDEEEMTSIFRESYISAAHILMHQIRSQKATCSSIYFTSAQKGEGKTIVVANLGIALSSIGIRVLLLDMDLSNPKLSNLFVEKVSHKKSLNALYYLETEPENAIIQINSRLDILPTAFEVNPMGINIRMREVVEKLSPMYDLILIDSAPIGQVSESLGLNRIADSIIFVTKFDDALISVLKYNIEKLHKSGAPILGCIVNAIPKASFSSAGIIGNMSEMQDKSLGSKHFGEHLEGNGKHSFRKSRVRINKKIKNSVATEVDGAEAAYHRIMSAVNSIDSDRMESLLLDTLTNLEDILSNHSLALYQVDDNGVYARLAVSSKEMLSDIKTSIKLEDYQEIIHEIGKKHVYSNSDMNNGLPMYAAGIMVHKKLEVLIMIHKVTADQFNIDYQETIRMSCDMFQMMYQQMKKQETLRSNLDYEPNTGIMEAVQFRKLVETYIRMQLKEVAKFTLLKLHNVNKWTIYEMLHGHIRKSDVLGYDEKGNIYLLVAQIDKLNIGIVLERIQRFGVLEYEIVDSLDSTEQMYTNVFLARDEEEEIVLEQQEDPERPEEQIEEEKTELLTEETRQDEQSIKVIRTEIDSPVSPEEKMVKRTSGFMSSGNRKLRGTKDSNGGFATRKRNHND